MMSPNKILAVLTLVTTLTISDFPVIQNPKSKIQNSQVMAQTLDALKMEADQLNEQGIQQAQAGQVEAALQSFQQALIIRREIKDRQGEGADLGNMGNAYYYLGDYTKAIDYLQQSLVIAREIKNRQGEGTALNNLGASYYSLRDYAKAIEYHQQSLAIAREIKDRQMEALALEMLSLAQKSQNQSSSPRKAEADRLLQQGDQQFRTSQVEAALQSWQQALIIYQEIKDRQGEGWGLGSLGLAYNSLRNYTKAMEYYQQSLAIAREIRDRQSEGKTLGNLGVVYLNQGNYAKAIEYSQQWLAIAREIKDRQSEGKALDNLGLAYKDLGDYAKAIEYYQQSLAIAREIKDRQSEGKALGNLGDVSIFLGDYAKAIEYLQQSLAIAREVKDRRGETASLGSLGLAYFALGDYTKTIEYHQQSLTISREIKDPQGEGVSLGNLGIVSIFLGDYAKGIDYQQQYLAIAREIKYRTGEGNALGSLGLAYYYLGDYAKAIEYHQQYLAIAREIKDPQGEGMALGNLGNAYYYLGDYAKAIEYHQQYLAITREIKDPQGEGNALNNLGAALHDSGNLTQAEKNLRFGIEVWESQRRRLGNKDAYKVSIFEEQARTYHLLQQVLIAQNKNDAALEIAEAGRAQALAELLITRLSANPTEQSPITSPTIEQIKQIAKEQNATLVEYSIIFNQSLYIWVIKPTGEIAFRSVNFNTKDSDQTELINTVVSGNGAVIRGTPQDTVVPELLAETRSALGVGRYATIEVEHKGDITSSHRLNQLHQLLIEPIANLLPTKPEERVIFIPQGGLFLVPFAALQDKKGDYLIEKHTISIAPSIQVLDLTHKQQQVRANRQTPVRGNEVLIVGNPTMPQLPQIPGLEPIKLPPLPGAEQEAKEIADFFGTQAITGNAATEKTITEKLSNARIIHLATHGLLEYGNPQDSGVRDLPGAIALAPSAPDDGLLTSAEISEMNLQAELVVLSACDTGQGRIRADGVVGLSRSLIKAGIPSTLVSLWSVPDAPTAELMTEFYRQWQQSSDKAQALRQAMLVTMRTHPNPRDWAAFTLIGEAE